MTLHGRGSVSFIVPGVSYGSMLEALMNSRDQEKEKQ
jgi:hypothetical protein